ncbi:hypothetical protein EYV94_01895 [Puteibacter caeruleilacunae]|nr:hypothetical protein EYV94_01895 [Puteibacter caeruleilacunae]
MIQDIITYVILITVGMLIAYKMYRWFKPGKIEPKASDCSDGCGSCALKKKCAPYAKGDYKNVTLHK